MFPMYICTMHNRIFIQSAVWVDCLALFLSTSLIFPAFVRVFLLLIRISLSFSCAQQPVFLVLDGFSALLEVMFTTSSKTTMYKSDYKNVRTCFQLEHAHSVHTQHTYACTGRIMYDTYIYIIEIPPFNSLAWGSLTLTPITLFTV